MFTRVSTFTSLDYIASNWLQFHGCGRVPGDPNTSCQFDSALTCLTAITVYFSDISGPWCSTTSEEVREVHLDYDTWCRYTQNTHEVGALVPVTLHHVRALSLRRLFALSEFGGTHREEYPMFQFLHNVLAHAARGTRRSAFAKPRPRQLQGWPKPVHMSSRGKIADAVPMAM